MDPESHIKPAVQAAQAETEVDFEAEAVPTGQLTGEDTAVPGQYLPAGQSEQELDPLEGE